MSSRCSKCALNGEGSTPIDSVARDWQDPTKKEGNGIRRTFEDSTEDWPGVAAEHALERDKSTESVGAYAAMAAGWIGSGISAKLGRE
jgi:hypothetical protein